MSSDTFNTQVANHTFCSICGIHSFYRPRSHRDKIEVNLRCLDRDLSQRFTIRPFDGQNWSENVSRLREN